MAGRAGRSVAGSALVLAFVPGFVAALVPAVVTGASPSGPGGLSAGTPADAEEEAQSELERIEALVQKGRHKEAQRAYAQLAESAPDTAAGAAAARRAAPSAYLGWEFIVESGGSENRIDVAVLGEGYQLDELKGFAKLAEDVPDVFRRQHEFGEYFDYFNFVRADLVSADNGVDGYGREYDTALGGHTIGTIQGHVAVDAALVYDMLDEMPSHDGVAIVFVKLGVLGTGGGGIATIGGRNMSTMVHEVGHAFCNLGDEYASKTHDRGSVRRRPNVSDTPDLESLPWAHWIEAGVKGVGAYEGAGGQVRGAWRPTAKGCVMASGDRFCAVCREHLVLTIYRAVDPIDACAPAPHEVRADDELVLGKAGLDFDVTTLVPASHALEVRFWVLPEAEAPRAGVNARTDRYGRYGGRGRPDRSRRGRLSPIAAEPLLVSRDRRGRNRLRLKPGALAPGRWRVVARALDTTIVKGSKEPWVLRDEDGLLESERAWWVRVE